MIYADIEHFRRTFCNCEPVRRVMEFLVAKAPGLEDGRHELGDGMYVLLKHYSPAPAAERRYETHDKFIDVQVVLEGEEIMYWHPLTKDMATTEDRMEQSDVRFYANPTDGLDVPMLLRPGLFAFVLPPDAHKPECLVKTKNCRKAIAKIPVELVKF